MGRRETEENFCVSVFVSFWATRKPLKVRIKEKINKGKREKVVKWREGKLFFRREREISSSCLVKVEGIGAKKAPNQT